MDEPWILTATGKKFFYLSDSPDQFDLEDVAISLSRLCRYNGHISKGFSNEIYSVAQHSVYVYKLLLKMGAPGKTLPWALSHDFPEAYWTDIPSPLKSLLPQYREMEERSAKAMRKKFGIPYDEEIEDYVKWADVQVLYAEIDMLSHDPEKVWTAHQKPLHSLRDIDPYFYLWSPAEAKTRLLEAFEEIGEFCANAS